MSRKQALGMLVVRTAACPLTWAQSALSPARWENFFLTWGVEGWALPAPLGGNPHPPLNREEQLVEPER